MEVGPCNKQQCVSTMFDCSRTSGLTAAGTIPFDDCRVDTTNNAMNPHTGIFTVGPGQAGIYEISFHGKFQVTKMSTGWCDIYVNDKVIADLQRSYNGPSWTSTTTHGMHLLYPLREKDKLRIQFNKDHRKDMLASDHEHDIHLLAQKVANLL